MKVSIQILIYEKISDADMQKFGFKKWQTESCRRITFNTKTSKQKIIKDIEKYIGGIKNESKN